jgi:hypothetical protein
MRNGMQSENFPRGISRLMAIKGLRAIEKKHRSFFGNIFRALETMQGEERRWVIRETFISKSN